ncbi:MAG TPA: tRNA (adenosine(37)-N6)-threonylcarbamoyltransferase complex transferase subunit TsaD [Candidatus Paceibacterota bacterium]|jgi:N6-L-threonylcarbamoyladenine synthase|nr:tRNA (adenosine(37)-N6)-threonylcarbamoyltransferase complex transferase subunit TsaD [Candidatus Paceibacterota bacterium]
MKILAIETSCDETAIAILACEGDEKSARFTILGNALLSQIEIHREFGGVFPAVAKREHAKNLVPLLEAALEEAELLHEDTQTFAEGLPQRIAQLLEREPELGEAFLSSLSEMEIPDIDAIAVTAGPGLEPALWVGVNFAKALSMIWGKPLIAANHMEGHALSALLTEVPGTESRTFELKDVQMPLLALLISGGHTELDAADAWREYRLIGQTRDDAVGEAFDKVARMLGLPYPGGPEVSRLAERDREDPRTNPYKLPRPMIDTGHCDFSFSGLKTAVLYLTKGKELTELEKEQLARAFEDAASDVLYAKTSKALEQTGARTLAIGGGVSANAHIRRVFREKLPQDHPEVSLFIPSAFLTGDNAIMIAVAGFYSYLKKDFADIESLKADGNLSLSK